MKLLTLACLPLLLLPALANAQSSSSEYSQSYGILMKGVVAGSERFTEKTTDSGNLVSTSDHEIFVTDGLETKRMAFSTRMVLAKSTGLPTSYAYKYSTGAAGDSYEVVVNNGRISRSLTRGGNTNEVNVAVPQNFIILDFDVYHQYDYLIRRYDSKQGGRQIFADFVPLIGTDIPVAVTFLGTADLASPQGVIPARNFKVEFVGIWGGSLFVDKEGRLLRLLIPAQDLEVVRSDLLPAPETKTEKSGEENPPEPPKLEIN
jgi:hypothetical protein